MSREDFFFDFDYHCDDPGGEGLQQKKAPEWQTAALDESEMVAIDQFQNVGNDESLRLQIPSIGQGEHGFPCTIDKQVSSQPMYMAIMNDTKWEIQMPAEINTFLNDTTDFGGFSVQNKLYQQIAQKILDKDTNLLQNSQINQNDHYIILDKVPFSEIAQDNLHPEQPRLDNQEQLIINTVVPQIWSLGVKSHGSKKDDEIYNPQRAVLHKQLDQLNSNFHFSDNKDVSSSEQMQINLLHYLNGRATYRSLKGSEVCEPIPREIDPNQADYSKLFELPVKSSQLHFNFFSEEVDQSKAQEKPYQTEYMELLQQNQIHTGGPYQKVTNSRKLKILPQSQELRQSLLNSGIGQTKINQTLLSTIGNNKTKDQLEEYVDAIPNTEEGQSEFNQFSSYQAFCRTFNIGSQCRTFNQIQQICQQTEQINQSIQKPLDITESRAVATDNPLQGQGCITQQPQQRQQQAIGLQFSSSLKNTPILSLEVHQNAAQVEERQQSIKRDIQSSLFKKPNHLFSEQSNPKGLNTSNSQNDNHHRSNKQHPQMEIQKETNPHIINNPNNMPYQYNSPQFPWYYGGGYPPFPFPFYQSMPNSNIETTKQMQCRQINLPSPLVSISINKRNEITLNMYGNNPPPPNYRNEHKSNQIISQNHQTNNQDTMIKTIKELVRLQMNCAKQDIKKPAQAEHRKHLQLHQNEVQINEKLSIKQPIIIESKPLHQPAQTASQIRQRTAEIEKNVQCVADDYLMNRALAESDHRQFQNLLRPYVLLKFTPEPIGDVGCELFKNGLILMAMVKLINRSSNTPFIYNYVYEYLSNTFRPTKNQFIFAQQAAKAKQSYQSYLDKQYLQGYANKRNELQSKQETIRRRTCDQIPFVSINQRKINSYQQTTQKRLQIGSKAVDVNQQLSPLVPERKEEKTQTKSKNINIPEFMNNCPSAQVIKKGILKTSQIKQSKKQKQNPIHSQLQFDPTEPIRQENASKKSIIEERQQQKSKFKNFDKINTMIKLSQKLAFGQQNTSEKSNAVQQSSKHDSMIVYDKKRQSTPSFNELYEKYKKIKDNKKGSREKTGKTDVSSKAKIDEKAMELQEIRQQKPVRKVTFQEDTITDISEFKQAQSLGKKRKTRSKSGSKAQVSIETSCEENQKEKPRKKTPTKK